MARFSLAVFLSLAALAAAHPGHDVHAEAARRAEYAMRPEYRSLDHCASTIKARDGAMIQRRSDEVNRLRAKRGIKKRNFVTVLATDHESDADVTPSSSDEEVFGSTATCILQDEVTEGPYYVLGEFIREDLTEGEEGVSITLDVQVVDTTTCEPLADVALEAWGANSTGVYGGVVAQNNGDTSDTSNLNNTAMRGIQITDDSGVLQFTTIFPGHYTGRTNHIHILAHIDATINDNSTLSGGTISHVGQLFFDQDLITEVEATSPYSTNTQSVTKNVGDSIFKQEAASSDPVPTYVLLGDDVSDGIFAWVTVGIDPTISKTVSAAAYYDASGGHEESSSGSSPGGGFPF